MPRVLGHLACRLHPSTSSFQHPRELSICSHTQQLYPYSIFRDTVCLTSSCCMNSRSCSCSIYFYEPSHQRWEGSSFFEACCLFDSLLPGCLSPSLTSQCAKKLDSRITRGRTESGPRTFSPSQASSQAAATASTFGVDPADFVPCMTGDSMCWQNSSSCHFHTDSFRSDRTKPDADGDS